MTRGFDLAAVLFAACVVLAGCTGGTTGTGATETTATTTETPAATTGTTTAIPGESTTPPSLARAHADALDAAANFTLRQSVSLSSSAGEAESISVNTTAYVDAVSGGMAVYYNDSRANARTTYVTASGDAYERTGIPSSGVVRYGRPLVQYSVDELRNYQGVRRLVDAFEFEPAGTTTLEGTRVRVYAVDSVEQVRTPDANVTQFAPANVTAFEVRAYVAESGLVRRFTYRSEAEIRDERRTFAYRFSYDDVNATAVRAPSWLDEAKAAMANETAVPDPTRVVTETVRAESLGAAVTVTGPKYEISGFELRRPDHWPFIHDDGDGFRKAQVSNAVRVPTSGGVELETLELTYNESAIPGTNESDFAVYRYNETLQTLFAVETTVDAEANVARVELDRGGTYLVMHTPTWRELWE